MRKIYLASPFFNEEELTIYNEVVGILRNMKNTEVFVPMEHQIPNAYELSNRDWARKVYELDIKALNECDFVFVLNFGMYSDSGTAWEAGYAFAKGKKVYQVLCNKNAKCDYSLMMTNGTQFVMTLDDLKTQHLQDKNTVLDSIIQK